MAEKNKLKVSEPKEFMDLSADLGKFKIKNPIMTASGTYGYCDEFSAFLDVSKLGAIVTKGITLEPRMGNEGKRLYETESGMINRIGLENIGIDAFLKTKLPELRQKGIEFVVNIAGSSLEDYVEIAKRCESASIRAIEVNVSCPNVKSGCIEFGTDEKALYELVSRVRKAYNGFLIIKLTPNVTKIEALAEAVEKAEADCISAINTVRGLGVDLNFSGGKVSKDLTQGGLSGKCIKPVALYNVKRIREAVKLPIIGLGGISCLQDILEFISVGASAVQIGTENFTNPDIGIKLAKELADFIAKNGYKNFEHLKEELQK